MSDPVIMPVSEEESKEVVVVNHNIVPSESLGISQVKERVELIHQLLKEVMIEGEHYGKIPGCKKDILMKSGAEKIGLTFRLVPEYAVERIDHPNYHREYSVTCTLRHNGDFAGQGLGSCSSLESKYRYRNSQRVCPVCGVTAIIKGKDEYGGGWLCWKKKDGCGATFGDEDPQITEQEVGKMENPDVADQYNTILKMAKKRAHVDAILTATAASDIFTQDLDDDGNISHPENEKPKYRENPKGNRPPKLTAEQAKKEILDMVERDQKEFGTLEKSHADDVVNRINLNKPYKGGWLALHAQLKEKFDKEWVAY